MTGIATGAKNVTKLKGFTKVQQALASMGDEIVATYQKAITTTSYKAVKKLSGELTTPKLYREYIKSGQKYAKELSEIPYSKWKDVVKVVKSTGALELQGMMLMVRRAQMFTNIAITGISYYAIAKFAQQIVDVERAHWYFDDQVNPWKSVEEGKPVYYNYNDLMLNELWNDNPVLLIKAWNDAKQFPPLGLVPVDPTIPRERWIGLSDEHGKENDEYYFGNDDYDSVNGNSLNNENYANPEKPFNTIMHPNPGGGWRPELAIWDSNYDLRFMEPYFREMNQALTDIFHLLDAGEIDKDEARDAIEKELNINISN